MDQPTHSEEHLPENTGTAFEFPEEKPILFSDQGVQGLNVIVMNAELCTALENKFHTFRQVSTPVRVNSFTPLSGPDAISSLIASIKSNREKGTKTVVISGDSSGLKAGFDALQFNESPFNMTMIKAAAGESLDRHLLEVKRPWLQGMFLLGTQAHLSDRDFMELAEKDGLLTSRLGYLRSDIGSAEPELRCSDLVGLSLNSMKYAESPFQNQISCTGFTAEEACQLLYYTGRGERNQICCLFDFKEEIRESEVGLQLLATLIWYYSFGSQYRPGAYPPSLIPMKRYMLEHMVSGKKLTFFKDEKEQKWWLAAPFERHILCKSMPLIACDYQDYRVAANDQMLTERLVNWFELYAGSELVKNTL